MERVLLEIDISLARRLGPQVLVRSIEGWGVLCETANLLEDRIDSVGLLRVYDSAPIRVRGI